MSLTHTDLPDFEHIAVQITERYRTQITPPVARPHHVADDPLGLITDALRAIWNARGAADAKIIDASLTSQMGVMAAGPYVKNLERAIKALDQT